MTILITGGAGFIGSNFVLDWFKKKNEKVINLDLLTYAGNLSNLKDLKNNPDHIFIKGDIKNKELVSDIFAKHKPRALINFAAESHVDRSIKNPNDFIQTNIIGTFNLLECALKYYNLQCIKQKNNFIFLHVSTDEVFGELNSKDNPFNEKSKYAPNSPYSASKASSDHLVRSFNKTYKLPVLITHCSNNYGPYQSTDKFIPMIINRAINFKDIPIYGDGLNIRDWLYVEDHCSALIEILDRGRPGQTYIIGAENEKNNNETVEIICGILDEIKPIPKIEKIKNYNELIVYVNDMPGHDRRYAVNPSKIKNELNWIPKETFFTGLKKTVTWYLSNQNWVKNIDINL